MERYCEKQSRDDYNVLETHGIIPIACREASSGTWEPVESQGCDTQANCTRDVEGETDSDGNGDQNGNNSDVDHTTSSS